jgi:DNA-binding Lrp family transcriptional regulator
MNQSVTEFPDNIDLLLLDALQDDIPFIPDPWEIIGKRIGISAEEVLIRLTRMTDAGFIRGIVPTLESAKIGSLVSTLVAMRVSDDKLAHVVSVVNSYSEVSHNYLRIHEYNLWFTLAAPSQACIDTITNEILNKTGLSSDDMLNLYTEKKYKIDVRFPILNRNREGSHG